MALQSQDSKGAEGPFPLLMETDFVAENLQMLWASVMKG